MKKVSIILASVLFMALVGVCNARSSPEQAAAHSTIVKSEFPVLLTVAGHDAVIAHVPAMEVQPVKTMCLVDGNLVSTLQPVTREHCIHQCLWRSNSNCEGIMTNRRMTTEGRYRQLIFNTMQV